VYSTCGVLQLSRHQTLALLKGHVHRPERHTSLVVRLGRLQVGLAICSQALANGRAGSLQTMPCMVVLAPAAVGSPTWWLGSTYVGCLDSCLAPACAALQPCDLLLPVLPLQHCNHVPPLLPGLMTQLLGLVTAQPTTLPLQLGPCLACCAPQRCVLVTSVLPALTLHSAFALRLPHHSAATFIDLPFCAAVAARPAPATRWCCSTRCPTAHGPSRCTSLSRPLAVPQGQTNASLMLLSRRVPVHAYFSVQLVLQEGIQVGIAVVGASNSSSAVRQATTAQPAITLLQCQQHSQKASHAFLFDCCSTAVRLLPAFTSLICVALSITVNWAAVYACLCTSCALHGRMGSCLRVGCSACAAQPSSMQGRD
jgi:hypothetical protein